MLETKVGCFLDHHSFKLDHKRMVVGVSGGPDSLALLHYLHNESEKRGLFLVTAHIDHMFRGEESYEDAMFVKHFCEQNRIPFEMAQINVPHVMETTGMSSQVAAREVRYEFYLKIMEKYNCSHLALAHHGDDQIETILMRLTRGSTGMARTGIPFTRPFQSGTIVRPFLCVTKAEIEDYCRRHQLTPRLDPSNNKNIYSRNRFRQQVLPFLKTENPQVHEHFQRFSEELQTDELFLQELTVQELNKVLKKRKECEMTVDIGQFSKMPLPLQRRGIQLILNYLYKENPSALSALHTDQVLRLIHYGKPSGRLDFPSGLKVLRSYGDLSFVIHEDKTESEPYYFVMNGPGKVKLPNGCQMELRLVNQEEDFWNSPDTAVFAADTMQWPIIIRTRETGDRMTLKGMQGSKKLKDIFIDHKIPLQNRNTWPVVTNGDNCIIWLPGLKKSSFEGSNQTTKQYIQLTYEK
ncbi:tRNA lysidine(34) synthetase TilS [Neobacillus kokaensis]|uniref:tRNA(Ile)-lysidine synthase n=1 Tax=Neobacillus kokaensis TaxID=2759023 RepID=A0ABQ3N7Y5_9BACI|nr:tRNA lysidine(34) synthetase TilS [Neobacillus kokaensis]GHI00855.1 tRNA(Ile)-lysidine synthase [Neobacillus kokaensis]